MKGKTFNSKDKHAAREAEKYPNPIPSREFILEVLRHAGKPLSLKAIIQFLKIRAEEQQEAVRRRLFAMVRDGQLLCNRQDDFALIDRLSLIPGTVQANKEGYGFVLPDAEHEDIYLNAMQMRRVFDGDRVLVRIRTNGQKGRYDGVIVEVLERNTSTIVGRFVEEQGISYVIPNKKSLLHEVLVPSDKTLGAEQGEIVQVEILTQPERHQQPVAQVIKVLGKHLDPGMEIDMAIIGHALPNQWSNDVQQEINTFATTVQPQDIKGRKDLRDLPLITIDGDDARDFDDAVYCEPKSKGGWRLVVAIADVSHYVKVNSALDLEAQNRGNSVYFPERVIPMLPEVLSNELCSLKPKVDRLCMVCDINISPEGEIERYRFYDAVMHSKARMTYQQVACIINGDTAYRNDHANVVNEVDNLHQLFKQLHQQRQRRGALDFDTVETKIIFSEQRKIEKIVPVKRNEAHMLIEECMLAANVCAARFLKSQKFPGLFRNHPTPNMDKLIDLRAFLKLHGLSLPGGKQPSPSDYQQLLQQNRDLPEAESVQTMILRSMSQAEYSPENTGHFGLAYDEYGHFTSPIRRYPDLLLHRAIRHFLNGGKVADFAYNTQAMQKLAEHCSMTERRADDATRDVVSWLKCEFMSHCVGQSYSGKITGVTSFGLFVQLDDIYVEGLVHVSLLDGDYYVYHADKQMLIGERTRIKYKLGQSLKIKVLRVDLELRRIDFNLLS